MEVYQPPSDSISRIQFSPRKDESDYLLASSWDNCVRLYDINLNAVRAVHSHSQAVLDCCFLRDSSSCISGGLAKDLRQYDFEKEVDFLVGKHTEPVKCVNFAEEAGIVLSGSWDKTVAAWDARTKNICHRIEMDGKVFAMTVSPAEGPYGKIIVGDSAKTIKVYDLRKLERPEEERRYDLAKYQIRCIESFSNGRGYTIGTTEGRVYYEYFNMTAHAPRKNAVAPEIPAGKESYSFKWHREKIPGTTPGTTIEKIYPVNCIGFHPKYNSFATGGGDGTVSMWDGAEKKRLGRLAKPFPSSITGLAFSSLGTKLAIAVSYDYAESVPAHDPRVVQFAQIVIRDVADSDIRPKTVNE